MANNRMHLVCNVCIPEGTDYDYEKWRASTLHLGKWYPGGAYYAAPSKELIEEFYTEHSHPERESHNYGVGAGQENPVRLEYEAINMPITRGEIIDV